MPMFRLGGMKMKKRMHLVDRHGLEDTGGSGIRGLMVFGHMSFIVIISKARGRGDLSFAQVMMMNQRLSFVMLFVGTSRHIIGHLSVMIFNEGIPDVLIQKTPDTGVTKQTTRKYPRRQRYLWRVRLLA
jgi:hypothetical protein